MKEPKIVGLIVAWGCEKWIRPAVEQALEYCDEVMAVVTSFTVENEEFEDNSYDIVKEYKDVTLLDVPEYWVTSSEGMAAVLNHMLQHSKLFVPGNWVWQLDSDEFYPKAGYEEVRAVIKEGEYDKIAFEEKYFFINMQHYLEGLHSGRLMRVETGSERFKPSCLWTRKGGNIHKISREIGMFHYSLLREVRSLRKAWLVEYPGRRQRGKNKAVRWLDEVYANYDLENEDYWNKRSFEVRGLRNPSWTFAVSPDKNGRLFRYNGKHPRVIEESGFTKIKDFRKENAYLG